MKDNNQYKEEIEEGVSSTHHPSNCSCHQPQDEWEGWEEIVLGRKQSKYHANYIATHKVKEYISNNFISNTKVLEVIEKWENDGQSFTKGVLADLKQALLK